MHTCTLRSSAARYGSAAIHVTKTASIEKMQSQAFSQMRSASQSLKALYKEGGVDINDKQLGNNAPIKNRL